MHRSLGHRLPAVLARPLFGDRQRFGPLPDENDPSWIEWKDRVVEFYASTQRGSVGHIVNKAGYTIVRNVDLSDKTVLEIGPAAIEHIEHWSGRPRRWINADIRESLLEMAAEKLDAAGVPHEEIVLPPRSAALPLADASVDAVFSFNVMEHIYPLGPHLDEIERVLRPGGVVVGSIPCEGGLAWGMGRYVTSRRWLLKNTTIDPNRLICWEHPNFADFILNALEAKFGRRAVHFWPLAVPLIDVNLMASFVFTKR